MTQEQPGFAFHQPADPENLTALRFMQEVSLPNVSTAVDIGKVGAFTPAEKVDIGAIAGQLAPDSAGLALSAEFGKLDDGLRKLREQEANAKLRRLLEAAQQKMEQERFHTAITLLDQALAIDGTSAPAWLLKGQCHYRLGEFQLALKELATAQEHAQDRETTLLVLMVRAACERAVVKAVESEIVTLLGVGELDKALALVERALVDQPTAAMLLFHRCGILFTMDRVGEARSAAQAARTVVSEGNAPVFDELLLRIALAESGEHIEAARRSLRRGDPKEAMRRLDACPSEVAGKEDFEALRSYAHERLSGGARVARTLRVLGRARGASPRPLDHDARERLLGWLLREELAAGVEAISRFDFTRANGYFNGAEKIDDRSCVVAFLHAFAIVAELRKAFDSKKPPSLDQAATRLSRAAQLADQGARDPEMRGECRTLAAAIASNQRELEKARRLVDCVSQFNSFMTYYQRHPIANSTQLGVARRQLEHIGRTVQQLRVEHAKGSEEDQVLGQLDTVVAGIRGQLYRR